MKSATSSTNLTSSASPSDIYDNIYRQEKRIKEIREQPALKTDRALANELHNIQLEIRNQYRVLILDHPTYCLENNQRHDIISLLWKKGFYRQIEDFRKSIKQFKAQFEAPNVNPQLKEQLQRHMVSLLQDFDSFLTYGIQFFQKLMKKLEKQAMSISPTQSLLNEYYTNTVQRCLIFLGDLSRYKELYAERDQKDFSESVRFYERAALVLPTVGMPHNQLAMLATYSEAESTALYHYCRSIMVESPFVGGFENMARLFTQNRVSFDKLQEHVQRSHFDQLLRSRKPDNTRFKLFLTRFVRLHGLLFAWSVRMHREYVRITEFDETAGTQSSAGSTTLLSQLNDTLGAALLRKADELDADKLLEMIREMLEELDVQLHNAKLTDLHLLRLVAISAFSVHFAENAEASGGGGREQLRTSDLSSFVNSCSHATASQSLVADSQQSAALKTHRSKTQSLALFALFGLVNRVTQRLTHADPHEKNRKMYNDKVLPMLAVFCQWLREHSIFLNAPLEVEGALGGGGAASAAEDVVLPSFLAELSPAASSLVFSSAKQDSPLARWRRRFLCAKEDLLAETRARSSLKSVLALFKSSLGGDSSPPSRRAEDARQQGQLLREHAELRGFLPLGDAFEESFAHFDPLRTTVGWLPESAARAARQNAIVAFVDEFLPATTTAPAAPAAAAANTKQDAEKRGRASTSGKAKTAKPAVSTAPQMEIETNAADVEEFPTLPGLRAKSAAEHVEPEKAKWGPPAQPDEPVEQVSEEEPVAEEEQVFSKKEKTLAAEEDVAAAAAVELADEDELFDDLDDVVFRPATRSALPAASPQLNFANLSSAPLSPAPGDFFSSLGINRSVSGQHLCELDSITQRNTSIWETLGLGESSGSLLGENTVSSLGLGGPVNDWAMGAQLGNAAWPSWPAAAAAPAGSMSQGPPGLSSSGRVSAPPGLGAAKSSAADVDVSGSNTHARSSFLAYLSETRS